MEAVDPPVWTVLVAAFRDAVTGDKAALVDVAEMVLNRAGGRLTEGYRRELRLTS
jgi:hypothetical protein